RISLIGSDRVRARPARVLPGASFLPRTRPDSSRARSHRWRHDDYRGHRSRGIHETRGTMTKTVEESNQSLVLEGFDTLFNKRDYAAAEGFWSPNYIQHSAHIPPGREGLFNLVKGIPPTLKYEPGLIMAEGEFVIVHGRFSGLGQPANWIAADILRINQGVMVEHWDVIQDEASRQQSRSGLPMFGDAFPK